MNNVLISSAPQPTGNVEGPSKPDSATGSNDQTSPPFAKVLARKVDKPAESKANAEADTSGANAVPAPAPQEQAAVPADALNVILAQIPVEMRGTNVADRMAQLASSERSAALDPASLRMSTPIATGLPVAPSSAAKGDTPFQAELSSQSLPNQLAGMDKTAATNTADPLAASEQQLFADTLRQSASGRQDMAVNPALLASSQVSAASISQATVAAMTGSSAANQPATATQTIATPLTSPAWGEDFSQKVSWMVSQKNQVAELHLNPPNLGPLDVVLKMSDTQATVLFTSPHAAVREAVENALPKLRELLADNGIMLSNATVGDQSPRDREQGEMSGQKPPTFSGNSSADDTSAASGTMQTLSSPRHNGMVDTFA